MRRASLALAGLLAAGPATAAGLEPMIPPPRLDKGACAVLVWSQADARGPLLLIAGNPPVARIQRDGRLKMLPRDGDAKGDGRQAFRGMGVRLALDVTLPAGLIVRGAPPPEGVLTITEAGRDAVMIPVTVRPACDG